MIFLDELKDLYVCRKQFLLPIDEKDKRHGSTAIILSPSYESTIGVLKHPLFVNKYYNSYFMERAVMYYVNQEGTIEEFNDEYIVETGAELLNPSKYDITFEGYKHQIDEAKKYINTKAFDDIFSDLMINAKKMGKIKVVISPSAKYSDILTINLRPYNDYPKVFESYEYYCKFAVYMWACFRANPGMLDWLSMGYSLYMCGQDFPKDPLQWKLNTQLGVVYRSIYNYDSNHGHRTLVTKVLRSKNGHLNLGISPLDLMILAKMQWDELKESTAPYREEENKVNILTEDSSYNTYYKRMLYDGRIKNVKELKEYYAKIKEEYPLIKYTYTNLEMYRGLNTFIDCHHYLQNYKANNTLTNIKGAKAFINFMDRLINDPRISSSGYKKKTIIIPVYDWISENDNSFYMISKTINPISCIFYMLNGASNGKVANFLNDANTLFLGRSSYFSARFSEPSTTYPQIFLKCIRRVVGSQVVSDTSSEEGVDSPKVIKTEIIDRIEKSQKITIDDISNSDILDKSSNQPDEKNIQNSDISIEDKRKKEIVNTVSKIAANGTSVEDTLENMDNNDEESERLKQLMSDLATNPDDRGNNISGARASRLLKLQNDFLDSEFEGKKIADILNSTQEEKEITPISINVDSVNPEWENLKFAPSMDAYDLDEDLVKIFSCFHDKSNPLVVMEMHKEDTSTSNDLKETYTVKYEAATGKRFTIKVDIPRFVDKKYMLLRGNRKNIPIQLFLMPIIKTEENAVQIISCYNKIFVRRFGENTGKSNVITDKLIKALRKENKSIKITEGDNTKICSKYEFPIDYIDLAENFSVIETPKYKIIFNYDEILKNDKIDETRGVCLGYNKRTKELVYFERGSNIFLSLYVYYLIAEGLTGDDHEAFITNFDEASTSLRYTYSRASILNCKIPLVIICCLAEGLESVLRKANIKYSISETRPSYSKTSEDVIKFKNAYLKYEVNYASSLLMNGLKQCNTEDYEIAYINSKIMYKEFLDLFGGRLKADGLDNFADLMIDPITRETLQHYKLPTDYVSVLLHANLLLSDNKFTKHGDIRASRRFRRIEQIASYAYEVLAGAYGFYSTGQKHGRDVLFSVKQSAVIDKILLGNTTNDQSILNALQEYEAYYTVTPQGPSGMNSDRAYSLDKRSFDESMLNVLSASTGFSGNVGISRQATIDANVEGARGYIYNDPDTKTNETNAIKTLCMSEAVIPYSSTRDDPMRLAMGFVQTQKHGMRCDKSDPLLITTGADEALPYIISNTFAYKAKENGKVVEIVEDKYMIVEYNKEIIDDTGVKTTHEYIDLSETVQKNSSSGFYITLKLDTDLKVNKTFKKGDIIAYDKESFSSDVGLNDNLAYNIGTTAKYAILNTDEGFEDSAIISDTLSEGLASDVVLEKVITVSKDTNVYNLVKKGQSIKEGDTLLVMQNAYDDEDVNTLLRQLAGSEEEITNLGRKPVTSKVTGIVQDIIIKRTCDLNEMSPTLKKIVSDYEKDINTYKKKMVEYNIRDTNKILPDTEKLEASGDLKKAEDSVVIKIYLKYHDKFSVGCKLIYGTAVKGVAHDIFPKGQEPYSQYRPDETIHALLSIGSLNARMVSSVLITNGIYKGLIEMSRRVKEMAGIPWEMNLLE